MSGFHTLRANSVDIRGLSKVSRGLSGTFPAKGAYSDVVNKVKRLRFDGAVPGLPFNVKLLNIKVSTDQTQSKSVKFNFTFQAPVFDNETHFNNIGIARSAISKFLGLNDTSAAEIMGKYRNGKRMYEEIFPLVLDLNSPDGNIHYNTGI
jgi:hypothetical protein